MSKLSSLPDSGVRLWSILQKRERFVLIASSAARVIVNLLDLVALAGVGAIAIIIGGLTTPTNGQIAIPVIGPIEITQAFAVKLAAGVLFVFLLKSGVAIVFNFTMGRYVASLERNYTERLLRHYFPTGTVTAEKTPLVDMQNTLLHSTNYLFSGLLSAAITCVSELTLLVFMLIAFTFVNPLAVTALVTYLGLVIWLLNTLVSKRIQFQAHVAYTSSADTLKSVKNAYSIQRELALSGQSPQWRLQISKAKNQYAKSSINIITLAGLPRYVIETALVLGVFAFLAAVVIFSDVKSQAVTLGVFLTGGLRLVASALPLQSGFNNLLAAVQGGKPALEALERCSENSSQGLNSPTERSRGGNLVLSKVGFSIGTARLLQNVSLEVPSKGKYAVVGPSGAGKTTLIELMLGLKSPSTGEILLGQVQVEEFIRDNPGYFAYVPQKPELVAGTLRQNFTLDSAESRHRDGEISQLILKLGLASAFERFGNNLDSVIEPDLNPFSGGELQRIGIARAMLGSPSYIVLDEATSALDSISESKVGDLIDQLSEKVGVIVIAHRLSTIKNAAQIAYLEKGRLIGVGDYESLRLAIPDFQTAIDKLSLNPSESGAR